jgi:hypothetical protein
MRQDQQRSPALFATEFNNAHIMTVTRSSRTPENKSDDDNNGDNDNDDNDNDNDDISSNDAARPTAGPSKRKRTSPEFSSMDEESSGIEDNNRPLSGVPSTIQGDSSDDEELDVRSNDDDADAEAARIDADLVASVGNAAADGGDH